MIYKIFSWINIFSFTALSPDKIGKTRYNVIFKINEKIRLVNYKGRNIEHAVPLKFLLVCRRIYDYMKSPASGQKRGSEKRASKSAKIRRQEIGTSSIADSKLTCKYSIFVYKNCEFSLIFELRPERYRPLRKPTAHTKL